MTQCSYTPCKLVDEGKARLLRPWQAARQIQGESMALFPRRPRARNDDAGDGTTTEPAASDSPLVRVIRAAGGRLTVDDAIRALGVPAREVLAEAGVLELDGLLRRDGPFLVA